MGVAFFTAFAVVAHPIFAIVTIPLVWIAYRIWRIGVYISGDGAIIREVLGSSPLLPWSDIDRFDWGCRGRFMTGGLYLRNGQFLPSFALNPPSSLLGPDTSIPRLLAALNQELERARIALETSISKIDSVVPPELH